MSEDSFKSELTNALLIVNHMFKKPVLLSCYYSDPECTVTLLIYFIFVRKNLSNKCCSWYFKGTIKCVLKIGMQVRGLYDPIMLSESYLKSYLAFGYGEESVLELGPGRLHS